MGLAVFAIPIILGLGANIFILEYDFIASLLLASMYASYTLISYPIVARYGLSRLRCVNFVVGGAMITDTLTLFVLAIVAGTFTGEADAWFVVFMLLKLLAIAAIIILLFPRIARYFFRNYNDSVIQYINNSTDCRTAQLLKYFGEKFDQKCMNCDNCDSLSGADTPSSVIDSIYHDICSQLSNGPKYGYELNLAIYNPEDIEYVIRTMTETGELIQCGLQIKLNK
jgi:hypothetical protein